MRIVNERNLAFKNQPRPLDFSAASKKIKPLAARAAMPSAELEVDLWMPHRRGSQALVATPRPKGIDTGALRVAIRNATIGQHSLPPTIRSKSIRPRGNRSRTFSKPLVTEGYLPAHLERRLKPRAVPRALATTRAPATGEYLGGMRARATTIFPPDDRRVFFDTAYPWCTCGRVDTPGGSASGVLVGPRHLLTVSHTIQWIGDNSAGFVRFRPMLFDTSAPFGEAWGTLIYSKRKNRDATLGWIDEQYDYVVVVLDRRIGDMTGWMGARGYTDDWDGGDYWSHIGYPGDIAGAARPTFQTSISVDGIWYELDSHEAMSHSADVWPGQSGGPFFGWWTGEDYPSVVAVQSTQNSDENKASGGQDLVDLIIEATNDNP